MSHAVVNPDREELIQCPYDPVHMISQMRFPYHLMKCRKNHDGKEYMQCPFDAKHVFPKSRREEHLAVCDKKAIVEPQLVLDDGARNLQEIIPQSKASAFSDFLSNEWDEEAPSAGATKSTFSSFSNPDLPDVNSFAAVGPSSTNSFSAGAVSSSTRDAGNQHGSISDVSNYQQRGSYSEVPRPRKPNNNGPGKNKYKSPSVSNTNAVSSASSTYSSPKPQYNNNNFNDVNRVSTNYYSEPPSYPSPPSTLAAPDSYSSPGSGGSSPGSLRKPNKATKSLKPEPIGSSYSSTSRSFGRGRARTTPEVSVLNIEAEPGSYKLPEQIDYYNPPATTMTSSFGRGRGAAGSEQPLRRPGVTDQNARVVLEKEKMKLFKKIRQTKVLEEKLEAGEVLEDNQVGNVREC